MQAIIYIFVAFAAALAGTVGVPEGSPGGYPGDLADQPAIVATLEPSCTEDVPVPTITAEVTNHGNGPVSASLHRNDVEIGALFVAAGQTESVSVASPHWEDLDNLFEISDDGDVLASLEHYFDCLHPILDVDIAPCVDGSLTVDVANSGHQGTHVTITRDGAVVAEPPVAPGHVASVEVEVVDEQLLEVHHDGQVLAAAVVECEVAPDGPPPGDDPVDEDDTPGPSMSEDDPPGPAIEEVPGDVPGSVGGGTGRDDELTDQSDEPEPTRPAEGDETRSDRGPAR
jgi:hypothetical protein